MPRYFALGSAVVPSAEMHQTRHCGAQAYPTQPKIARQVPTPRSQCGIVSSRSSSVYLRRPSHVLLSRWRCASSSAWPQSVTAQDRATPAISNLYGSDLSRRPATQVVTAVLSLKHTQHMTHNTHNTHKTKRKTRTQSGHARNTHTHVCNTCTTHHTTKTTAHDM